MSQNGPDNQFDASEDNESQLIVEKKRVLFNEKGQPVGLGSAQFATFVGKMARMHCPPTYSDWPSVPKPIKETIWNVVLEVYDLEPVRRVCVLYKANVSWKDWKYKLRKIYDGYPTNVERKRNIPMGMRKEDWENFVDFCSSDVEQIKREIGRVARKHMNLPHTSGRRGSARTEEHLIKESSDGKVTRTQLFLETHITKDGTCPKVDEIKKLVSDDPYLGERDLDNDPVAMVCGRDGKGRVRALGSCVSKTMINVSAPFREIAEKEKRKSENAETNIKLCMQRLEEEIRARKLLEEKLTTYMNGSTDFAIASQPHYQVLPPEGHRTPGRPKKNRRLGDDELEEIQQKKRKCGEKGHCARSCGGKKKQKTTKKKDEAKDPNSTPVDPLRRKKLWKPKKKQKTTKKKDEAKDPNSTPVDPLRRKKLWKPKKDVASSSQTPPSGHVIESQADNTQKSQKRKTRTTKGNQIEGSPAKNTRATKKKDVALSSQQTRLL